jgi:hypothetical protein
MTIIKLFIDLVYIIKMEMFMIKTPEILYNSIQAAKNHIQYADQRLKEYGLAPKNSIIDQHYHF